MVNGVRSYYGVEVVLFVESRSYRRAFIAAYGVDDVDCSPLVTVSCL
jgi:hypothetical protein